MVTDKCTGKLLWLSSSTLNALYYVSQNKCTSLHAKSLLQHNNLKCTSKMFSFILKVYLSMLRNILYTLRKVCNNTAQSIVLMA